MGVWEDDGSCFFSLILLPLSRLGMGKAAEYMYPSKAVRPRSMELPEAEGCRTASSEVGLRNAAGNDPIKRISLQTRLVGCDEM